ncbi:Uncharacterized protein APZ42_011563 [Daphnia magna]|uniref:Uncharacterized protein n=1 Tax=Daphnia magna TaxID=35525 RepID=A0A162SSG5_9CRUS|nr:Uncharacterized protein APZ42_011563 [Daphnia magna]
MTLETFFLARTTYVEKDFSIPFTFSYVSLSFFAEHPSNFSVAFSFKY